MLEYVAHVRSKNKENKSVSKTLIDVNKSLKEIEISVSVHTCLACSGSDEYGKKFFLGERNIISLYIYGVKNQCI